MANYLVILMILFVLSHTLHLSSEDEGTTSQPTCPQSFSCSFFDYLSYPFYTSNNSACGLCEVIRCDEGIRPMIKLNENYPSYDLLRVQAGGSVTSVTGTHILVYNSYFAKQINTKSCDAFMYRSPPNSPSISYFMYPTISILRCKKSSQLNALVDQYFGKERKYYSYKRCANYSYYYLDSSGYISANPNVPSPCDVVRLPVKPLDALPNTDFTNPFNMLTPMVNFVLQVSDDCQKCHMRGGKCSIKKNQSFRCIRNAKKEKPRNIVKKSALVTFVTGAAIISILVVLFFKFKMSSRYNKEKYSNVEAFIRNHESLAPKRYTYSSVRKMTDSFKVKVGEGGYGSVYQGTLRNGNSVAVKLLNELKGSGEDLVNELTSISKTCHVNIVNLLGFCFEGRHRALIYEYMPNGSLEKFIYNRSSPLSSSQLEWKKLYEISIGIGRGLEYLHRGCNTQILHFDIKPHNILLDQDFCPKISDFGLAKLCPEKRSVVSMSGMRGTPGYIAPEVFSRNFGGVSHKSDVYSYGMMVLEMVGGRRDVVVEDDDMISMHFPHSIYNQLVSNRNLGLRGILNEENEEDEERVTKMVLVSFWCIQGDPSSRPSMSKVLEMLEGNLDTLEVPPKPFLFDHPTSPAARH